MQCPYYLGKYLFKNYSIYKRSIWPFYRKILEGPFSYREGVKKVNELNGIIEKEPDYSHLTPLDPKKLTNDLEGRFLVNFKKPEAYFGNDPLPAEIKPYKGRLDVEWVNGSSCVIDVNYINIWELDN